MSNLSQPTSRLLVLDDAPEHIHALQAFCDERHLIVSRIARESLSSVLTARAELGAIVLAESYASSLEETADLVDFIRSARPEIPLILRRESSSTMDDLPASMKSACCTAYRTGDWDNLQTVLDEFIFALVYPNALVRGIQEITHDVLGVSFSGTSIVARTPSISRDRIIFGEVFSLIPLESVWCRGYMMIQVDQEPLLKYLAWRDPYSASTFHKVNNILSEATNLVWGAIKNRFIGDDSRPPSSHVQVPLVVNHHNQYISFGSENPQLCFEYRLREPESGVDWTLYQRFIFSLSWSPEDFREIMSDAGAATSTGELELF